MLLAHRRGRRLDRARVRDAGPRDRGAARRARAWPDAHPRARVPGDRRRRRAGQQRRDRGGWRFAGPWRDPGHDRADRDADGTWRLTGEKTWTTWLPDLTHAFVTARIAGDGRAAGGRQLPRRPRRRRRRSDAPGSRRWACAARRPGGSILDGRPAGRRLVVAASRRRARSARARAAAPGSGPRSAAAYLGIGEGARDDVARWALDRRPGDGSTAVADVPSVQVRLGRMDAELRAARIVAHVARRWPRPLGRRGRRRPHGPRRWPSWSPRGPRSPPRTRRCGSPAARGSSPAASSGPSATRGPGSSTRRSRTSR